ncbi:unnamed protein product [Periconia digitata]|uniref:Uncharacterized protein n=1 Tax=Periconia digitata TaxID=1303443 RepID=A0A9W4URD8_9PLEO|nr:unnamed protein product [Periconia digitata]
MDPTRSSLSNRTGCCSDAVPPSNVCFYPNSPHAHAHISSPLLLALLSLAATVISTWDHGVIGPTLQTSCTSAHFCIQLSLPNPFLPVHSASCSGGLHYLRLKPSTLPELFSCIHYSRLHTC